MKGRRRDRQKRLEEYRKVFACYVTLELKGEGAEGCGSFQTAQDKITVLLKERVATSWCSTTLLEHSVLPLNVCLCKILLFCEKKMAGLTC